MMQHLRTVSGTILTLYVHSYRSKPAVVQKDCAYCGQAARYHADIKVKALMQKEEVLSIAARAKVAGSTRFCMAAAWREVKDNRDFDRVLDMVRGVNELGLEVCCTFGMLTESQAQKLQEAGLYAYNHNLDSSENYYEEIITTRTYGDRLNTIKNVRNAGITVLHNIRQIDNKQENNIFIDS